VKGCYAPSQPYPVISVKKPWSSVSNRQCRGH